MLGGGASHACAGTSGKELLLKRKRDVGEFSHQHGLFSGRRAISYISNYTLLVPQIVQLYDSNGLQRPVPNDYLLYLYLSPEVLKTQSFLKF